MLVTTTPSRVPASSSSTRPRPLPLPAATVASHLRLGARVPVLGHAHGQALRRCGRVAQLSEPNVHLFFGGTASRPPGWDIRCSAYFRSYASTGSIDQPEEHSSLLFFLRRACTDHDAAVRVRAMCPPAGGAAGCASTRVRRRAEGGGQSTPGYRDETASSNGAVGDKQNDGRRHSQGGRCFFF